MTATSGRFIRHRWAEIRIDERPRSGTANQTGILFVHNPIVPGVPVL